MIAQSGGQRIEGIDIQKEGANLAATNFKNSPWSDKLIAGHLSINTLCETKQAKYHLIVSNPPYFEPSEMNSESRKIARQQEKLSYPELVKAVSRLLRPEGRFSVILPAFQFNYFKSLLSKENLSIVKLCRIRGNSLSPVKRILLQAQFSKDELNQSELIIETKRNTYTAAYQKLLEEYLIIF